MSNLRGRSLLSIFMFVCLSLHGHTSAEVGVSTFLDSDIDKTISMDLQDASLKDVLKIFSIQSGLNFIASEAIKERKITLYLDNVPIKEAMVKLFKANRLIYDFDEEANIFTVNYADDTSEPDMITKVFPLKHRSVASANMERERQNLFTGSSVTSGSFSGQAVQSAAPAAQGTTILDTIKQVLSKTGKATEDSKTNSLIVTDVVSRFPMIEQIIAMLDVPQAQVMLEVEMLDVSKNAVDALGFNFGDMDSPNPLTWILGNNKNSIFFGPGNALGNLPLRGADIHTTGIAGNVVMGSTYASVLDFLKQQKDTKFLARPRILTLNNETAEIGITKDEVVAVETTEELDENDQLEETTTFTRATDLKLTPEGIGIFLRVTPQINLEAGEITLVVNPKTSSTSQSERVDSEENLALDPEIRSTKSIVRIKDGDTVILGGLIHKDKETIRRKVPILGDVPILGAMFRHKETTKDIERELLVFITPHIIQDSAVQYSRPTQPVPVAAGGAPVPSGRSAFVPSERRQAIANMLNTFER